MKFILRYCILLSFTFLTGANLFAQQGKSAAKPAAPAKAAEKEEDEDEGEMFIDVKAGAKDALFKSESAVRYKVGLKSTYKDRQEGTFKTIVTAEDGSPVYQNSISISIGRKGSRSVNVSIPPRVPGFYRLSFQMNLTSYDDTVKKVFGVSPDKIVGKPTRPSDFMTFWNKSKTILQGVKPQYKVTEDTRQSTPDMKVYLVEMHSWGDAVIRGWLTIPTHRPKRLPVRYRVPGYLVAMEPSFTEEDFAVFQINVRGNGNSKDAIDTHGLQYNWHHLVDKDTYVYRAVYMDCLRGVDFICDNAARFGIDTTRISIDGGSQGGCLAVVTAALDKRIKAVTTEVPLYADLRTASHITRMQPPPKGQTTPVWWLNNYVETHKDFTYERLYRVWDYFDPLNFASMVKVPVLMGIGLLDPLCPPVCSMAMYNQIGSEKKEYWVSADKAHEVDPIYYRFQYVWLRENLLLP